VIGSLDTISSDTAKHRDRAEDGTGFMWEGHFVVDVLFKLIVFSQSYPED
jgi:hypothetical protein